MYKRIALVIFAISLLFLVREGVQSWRIEDKHIPSVKKPEKAVLPSGIPQEKVSFYPQVPAKLPDLNEGYLFNEERSLISDEDAIAAENGDSGKNLYPIDMDKVFYAGSIIIGERRKGLVSFDDPTYNLKKKDKKKDTKGKTKVKSAKKTQHTQLQVNDKLGAYTVTAVEADRIIFEKGGKSIEKMLYDSNKTRIKPPARKKVVRKKKAPTKSTSRKVKLGTKAQQKSTTRSKTVKKPKVVESRRKLSPNPAMPTTRKLELPRSR